MNEQIKTLATKKETKTLAKKAELKAEQDKIVKLQIHGLNVFINQSYFANDGAQHYLMPITTDNSLSPSIVWYGDSNFCLIFKGSCLNRKNATFTPWNRIIFVVVYELDA